MKNIKHYLLFIMMAITIVSCHDYKSESKKVVTEFMNSVKGNNVSDMQKYYPEVKKLDNYYKTNSFSIKSVKEIDDDYYQVTVSNSYKTFFGDLSNNEISFFLAPSEDGKTMVIKDSDGLSDLSDLKVYKYAERMGYLPKSHLRDQAMASCMLNLLNEALCKAMEIKEDIYSFITISHIDWQTGYFDNSGSGSFVVNNDSEIPFINPVYKLYFEYKGDVITEDKGLVCSGTLEPGEKRSVSFYTPYVGHANRVRVAIEPSVENIIDGILDSNYDLREGIKAVSE